MACTKTFLSLTNVGYFESKTIRYDLDVQCISIPLSVINLVMSAMFLFIYLDWCFKPYTQEFFSYTTVGENRTEPPPSPETHDYPQYSKVLNASNSALPRTV